MSRVISVFLLLLCFASAPKMHAWGCQGHQAVALIAYDNLSPSAKKAVDALLSDAQKQYTSKSGKTITRECRATTLASIAYFATWADDVRMSLPKTAEWHFWDIPLATNSASLPQFCGGDGCVVQAIHDELAILTSTTAARADKQQALLFVIHLAGDLHQPMHIVDNGDRGGNCVPVNFQVTGFTASPKLSKGSYEPNLHSIWDSNMIAVYSGMKTSTPAAKRDGLTLAWVGNVEQTYASDIQHEKSQAMDLSDAKTLSKWAVATHKLAGPDSYSKMPQAIPVDPSPVTVKSCSGISAKFLPLHEAADQGFSDDAKPVIEKQIALAGGRLAAILNTVWK